MAPKLAVIGGAGHVGLPLSLRLAERGLHVVVVDVNAERLRSIQEGNFPFLERGGAELLKASKTWTNIEYRESGQPDKLKAALSGCEAVLLTIGTPVDEHLNPQLSPVFQCIEELRPYLQPRATLILRSTVFPGTSEMVHATLQEAGLDVGVAFCPERIAQGLALEELLTLPQIISGTDSNAVEVAKSVFAPLGVDLIEMTLLEAEVSKLFLNAWRYVQFATANQFYGLALAKGLDFDRIRRAITHRYDRARHLPNAGLAAGPCLFKDTMQLAAFSRQTFSLGHAAMLVNETLPEVLIEKGKELMGSRSLRGMTVGILGMAFKPDNDDERESLAFKLRRLLRYEGSIVLATDVYIKCPDFEPLEKVMKDARLLFVGCPHREYLSIKPGQGQAVVDCWGSPIGEERRQPLKIHSGICRSQDERTAKRARCDAAASPHEAGNGDPTRDVGAKRFLVTGSHGFIMMYVIPKLLERGHEVWGIDNFWKYGELRTSFDDHPRFHFIKGDAKDKDLIRKLVFENNIQIFIAAAAIIGGISMFHKLAYFLLSENEGITSAAFDSCVAAWKEKTGLEKIVVISSSMVFESAETFPSREEDLPKCPPPASTYGFQKLACEYFAKGAFEQHGLPFVIVRPFNAVGIGERRAKEDSDVMSGNVKLAMSHVVPDLVQKVLKGQDPLHILGAGNQVRHYTYAGDLAEGIVRCCLDPRAMNDSFNISTAKGHTVLQLAETIWRKIHGPEKPFSVVSDTPFTYDVQMRVPCVDKARDRLGIECTTSLEDGLEEIIPWIRTQLAKGTI